MNKKPINAFEARACPVAPSLTPAGSWLVENAEGLRSSNEFVERHGVPLQQHSCIPGVVALVLQRGR